MSKKLAIKGHPTRGKEVIELLKMMGGENINVTGGDIKGVYLISTEGTIETHYTYYKRPKNYVVFTLEEFLEKYPFKVGDKVIDVADRCPGVVSKMKWDEALSDMKYCVTFGNGIDFGWYVNDSIDFFKIKKNENLEETQSKREYDELRMPLDDDDKLATEVTIMGKRILPPDGYLVGKITQTDNGMLVEYVEKKPEYSTTYEECYDEGNTELHFIYVDKDERDLYESFIQLIRCRNAYWKIAGEEMGLGRPWEPDWDEQTDKFTISNKCNEIYLNNTAWYAQVLSFPTAKMRDAFYENFKNEIEQCKELL